jgi:poly-gamma-glutamate synthesis protein (capsule biosynthesis protein)
MRLRMAVALALAAGLLAACGAGSTSSTGRSGPVTAIGTAPATAPAGPRSAPPATPAPTTPAAGPITLAFAGDTNETGGAGSAVKAGLPDIRSALGAADFTVVNLETAITDRGTAASKEFTFRGPTSTLTSLKDIGIDLVSGANNHGLDYGPVGLQDTLAASKATGLPLVGLGQDEDQAYAPYLATVKGQRVAVIGATQVLDAALVGPWTAGPGKPGMASAKRVDRLVAAVQAARAQADTVVVFLHWGQELNPCPLPTQQSLAQALVDAGADVVVGSHAHVLLGGGYLGKAYVDYGLGNFAFDAHSAEGARTGVLTLTVQGRSVLGAVWTPAVIKGGSPTQLSGAAATAALADKDRRRGCTGLSAAPS